jgi:hypothetical protein
MTIITRTGKGSELTHEELDGNFTDLDARTAAHTNASDPHPQYLTSTEANGLYSPIGAVTMPEVLAFLKQLNVVSQGTFVFFGDELDGSANFTF